MNSIYIQCITTTVTSERGGEDEREIADDDAVVTALFV